MDKEMEVPEFCIMEVPVHKSGQFWTDHFLQVGHLCTVIFNQIFQNMIMIMKVSQVSLGL
jgi:hypothetical protein